MQLVRNVMFATLQEVSVAVDTCRFIY